MWDSIPVYINTSDCFYTAEKKTKTEPISEKHANFEPLL